MGINFSQIVLTTKQKLRIITYRCRELIEHMVQR